MTCRTSDEPAVRPLSHMWSISRRRSVLLGPGRFGRRRRSRSGRAHLLADGHEVVGVRGHVRHRPVGAVLRVRFVVAGSTHSRDHTFEAPEWEAARPADRPSTSQRPSAEVEHVGRHPERANGVPTVGPRRRTLGQGESRFCFAGMRRMTVRSMKCPASAARRYSRSRGCSRRCPGSAWLRASRARGLSSCLARGSGTAAAQRHRRL